MPRSQRKLKEIENYLASVAGDVPVSTDAAKQLVFLYELLTEVQHMKVENLKQRRKYLRRIQELESAGNALAATVSEHDEWPVQKAAIERWNYIVRLP